jgi:hypothetical protein
MSGRIHFFVTTLVMHIGVLAKTVAMFLRVRAVRKLLRGHILDGFEALMKCSFVDTGSG